MFDYLRHLVSITFVITSFALSAQSPDIALDNVADSACTQSENVAPVDECQPLETQESITTMALGDNEQQVTATRDIKLEPNQSQREALSLPRRSDVGGNTCICSRPYRQGRKDSFQARL